MYWVQSVANNNYSPEGPKSMDNRTRDPSDLGVFQSELQRSSLLLKAPLPCAPFLDTQKG